MLYIAGWLAVLAAAYTGFMRYIGISYVDLLPVTPHRLLAAAVVLGIGLGVTTAKLQSGLLGPGAPAVEQAEDAPSTSASLSGRQTLSR